MSERNPEEVNELALILGRVSVLAGGKLPHPEPDKEGEEIPLLTDIYEGGLLPFVGTQAAVETESLPRSAEHDQENRQQPESEQKIEDILVEMTTLIQVEVKKAVLQELVKVDKKLSAKLEKDLLKILRKRLEATDKTSS